MKRYYSKKVDNEFGHFDSQVEAEYNYILVDREKKGEITNLERQKTFLIQDKFKMNNGESIRKIEYLSDFSFVENGKLVIVDVKGSIYNIQDVFKIKWKCLKNIHRDCEFQIILKSKGNWFNIENKEEKKAYKESIAKKKSKTTEENKLKKKRTVE